METEDYRHTPIPNKTCARCGKGFNAEGREYYCPDCKGSATTAHTPSPTLTFRELQLVDLIRQAKSNKLIAHELCLTLGTVKEYNYHLFRKLGVRNRTELALLKVDQLGKKNELVS